VAADKAGAPKYGHKLTAPISRRHVLPGSSALIDLTVRAADGGAIIPSAKPYIASHGLVKQLSGLGYD
jgi:hypothetical protein